jgi:hypothetical protein
VRDRERLKTPPAGRMHEADGTATGPAKEATAWRTGHRTHAPAQEAAVDGLSVDVLQRSEIPPHRYSTVFGTIQGRPHLRPDTGALGVVTGAVGLELPGGADHLDAELAQLDGDRLVLEMPVGVE